jgi:hypothetical protein
MQSEKSAYSIDLFISSFVKQFMKRNKIPQYEENKKIFILYILKGTFFKCTYFFKNFMSSDSIS